MAYKFQLGKMTTQAGSIKLIDGNFTVAEGGAGEITSVNVEAVAVGGGGGTISIAGSLALGHASKGLIIDDASAAADKISIAGSMDNGHELISAYAQSNQRGQLIMRRRNAANDASHEMLLCGPSDGSSDNNSVAADHGFLQLGLNDGSKPIRFDGNSGDAVLTSMTLAAVAGQTINVGGNLVASTTLAQTGANSTLFEVDSSTAQVAGLSLTVADGYDGTTYDNDQTKGGFLIQNTAQMILKKQNRARVGGDDNAVSAIEFLSSGGSVRKLEASSFIGESKLVNVDANAVGYSPTLSTITAGTGNALKNQLNVIAGTHNGTVTVTIPAASSLALGQTVKIINLRANASSTNKVVIARSASDTFDGETSFEIHSGEAVVTLVCVNTANPAGKYMIM